MVGQILTQIITSFIASAGFGVLFNTPKRFLLACGISGMTGWVVYTLFMFRHAANVPSTLVATFFVGILGQVFARVYKAPIIIFNASGIIPLVPGALAYAAMLNFVHNDYTAAIQSAARVFLISGAIAVGLLFSEVAYRAFYKVTRT